MSESEHIHNLRRSKQAAIRTAREEYESTCKAAWNKFQDAKNRAEAFSSKHKTTKRTVS